MKIYIIRHGETAFNRQGKVQGSGIDSSLNEKGIRQAKAFHTFYKKVNFDLVLTSKLRRTHETVAAFIDAGIAWEQFEEINEISWGVFEGKKPDAKMIETYKKLAAAWEAGDLDARIEQGESARELGNRLARFVKMLQQRKTENLLVCMHGRSIRALICLLKNHSLDKMNLFPHSNTGLYLANYQQDKFSFELENDTSHLVGI